MMSVQGEADYLRRSMLAGAREFLVKPFSSDELTASIRQVYTRERDKQSRMAPLARRRGRRWRQRRRAGIRRTRPGRRGVQPEGRRRQDHRRRQPRGRGRQRARQEGRRRRRLVPVRRRRRPAEPQPEEQVDRGPHPRARSRRARVDRHVRHQPLGRHPRPPGPAVAGDGRADHAERRQEGHRGAAPRSRPRDRRLHLVLQRHDAGDPRLRRCDPDDAHARDHEHQEHAPVPGGHRAARLREGQGPSRAQPRRLGAGHPRRGRGTLDRPQGRRHDRQRRPKRGLRAQPGRTVLPVQPGGAGLPGHPPTGPAVVGERAQVAPTDDAGKAVQKKSLFAWR